MYNHELQVDCFHTFQKNIPFVHIIIPYHTEEDINQCTFSFKGQYCDTVADLTNWPSSTCNLHSIRISMLILECVISPRNLHEYMIKIGNVIQLKFNPQSLQ